MYILLVTITFAMKGLREGLATRDYRFTSLLIIATKLYSSHNFQNYSRRIIPAGRKLRTYMAINATRYIQELIQL